MKVTRRNFLKYCIGSAAALGLDFSLVGKLQNALAGGVELPTVIWLNGANCTGCTVSLANLLSDSAPTDVADLLINTLDLAFHPNLMGAAGDLAVESLNKAASGDFILAVDGGIPTAFDGHTCLLWTETDSNGNKHEVTAMEAVQRLAPDANAILSIGTCSSFGGIPAGNPNPTGVRSVGDLTGLPTINIPGCPPHPDWIVGSIALLLAGVTPALDSDRRPAVFYSDFGSIHSKCPRREREEAETFGMEGYCLKELGCNGPRTKADCPARQWNNKTNWCIGANSICLGCVESGFPDQFSPFYRETDGEGGENKPDESPAIQVTKAEWKTEDRELIVEGRAAKSSTVVILNASTGVEIASTLVKESEWKFRVRRLSPAPCRVKAESGGVAVERVVRNAPGNCV